MTPAGAARPLALALGMLLPALAVAQDAPLSAPSALEPAAAAIPPVTTPPPVEPPEPLPSEPDDATPSSGIIELKYLLQRVRVVGNANTSATLIKQFVPVQTGSTLDPNDPEIEALRYRLLGTGWFDRVDLRLERGTSPGWVVLVIEVEERSTLVFQQLAAGMGWSVEGLRGRTGDDKAPRRRPEPYIGLGIAETNLLGTGRTLSAEMLAAPDQGGAALSFYIPSVRLTGWSLRLRGSLVKGREYFGDKDVRVSVGCYDVAPMDASDCEESPDAAVVEYWRSGLSIGTSRDIGAFTRLSLEWHGDFVKVPPGGVPAAASERRGRTNDDLSRVPIDFSIEPGNSYVSMLTVGLLYDKRDSAILPTRGSSAIFSGDLASSLIGSDYSFMRVQASFNHWFPLRWGHTIRVGAFAGAVFGYAPFFYKFFVTDLTDLQPSRILGLNLDHRPAPNLLGGVHDKNGGTAVAQMRQEELAGRVDLEYAWPLVRGRRKFVKAADAFALVGFYGLSDPDDLRVSVPGYRGIAKLPIDLTFDAGVRLDTRIGVFQIGIAKLFWLPFK
jgi:outer membrane protein insertion porin family